MRRVARWAVGVAVMVVLCFASVTVMAQEIEVNTAGKGKLMKIKGIGSSLANRIIKYRKKHGPYKTPADLAKVKGIGKKMLEKMLPYLLFDGKKMSDAKVEAPKDAEPGAKVNINTADVDQLCTIKGVGKGTAQKIVDFRKEKGEFKSIDDLTNIKGIGKKKVENMKPFITVVDEEAKKEPEKKEPEKKK